jgi:hypothetical protein
MAALALVARPWHVGVGLVIGVLLALVVVPAPEPRAPEAHIELGSWDVPRVELRTDEIAASLDVKQPPACADAQDWPRGMVMGRNVKPVDRMDSVVVAQWLSGLLRWLASGAA